MSDSDPTSAPLKPVKRYHVIFGLVLALITGVVSTEILVRVLVPSPIYYSAWFTPGVHERDEEFGFVFRPDYRGAMRHSDGVWYQPLTLDPDGFRLTASVSAEESPSEQWILLGGASMAFSFGLDDQHAIHGQLAANSTRSLTAKVVSWPGFTVEQDLRKLERFLDADEYTDAIVFAYSAEDFEEIRELAKTPKPSDLQFVDGVVMPNDPVEQLVGPIYYRSVVVAGVSRWVYAFGKRLLPVNEPANPTDDVAQELATDGELKPRVMLAAERLREMGIPRVQIVALPHQLQKNGPKTLPTPEDADIIWLDLRDLPKTMAMDWIAGGHFGNESSAMISKEILRSRGIAAKPSDKSPVEFTD